MLFKTKIKIRGKIIALLIALLTPVMVFAANNNLTRAEAVKNSSQNNIENRDAAQQGLFEKFTADFFLNLLLGLLVLVATVLIAKLARNRLVDIFEKKMGGDMSGDIAGVVFRTVNIVIWTIGFTTALALWGVDLAFLMGGVGIGLGFTMQVFLGNFISGLIVIFSGDYQTGKIIEIAGQLGTIKRITSMFTTIEKYDGTCYNVPNIKFLQDEVLVYNLNSKRRVDIDFGVEYTTDLTQVKKLAIKVTESFPVILQNPSVRVLVRDMEDDGVVLTLQFWVASDEGFYQIKSNVTETLNMVFEQAGVQIKKRKLEVKQVEKFPRQ
ncbi:MAG: mechanosensitive ion channel [Candidatus Gracilibacteria bacterium]|nr:mechanosensitive ion channel [Candidatus Gracilibacteria bacterium]